jgi:hypothetical protein
MHLAPKIENNLECVFKKQLYDIVRNGKHMLYGRRGGNS